MCIRSKYEAIEGHDKIAIMTVRPTTDHKCFKIIILYHRFEYKNI